MQTPSQPGLPDAFFSPASSSFMDLLAAQAPELLPHRRVDAAVGEEIPHGTTIVAATFAGGVIIAGDRRTTMGNLIAGRDLDKLAVTDEYSAVGFAGTVGISLEMVRLYAMELKHYEKIEGVPLSLAGKTNRLAAMVRANLGAAEAGMVSIPLFAGYDVDEQVGRIVSFDVAGGQVVQDRGYDSIGSGSLFAKSALKKLHDPDSGRDETLRALVEALYDAAEDDSATGGPDMVRRIFPTAIQITADGAVRLSDQELENVAEAVVAGRAVS